jgi:hypothetical protein
MLTILVLGALAEEALESAPEIALLEEVVAHGIEERLGVEVQDVLGAVPERVAKAVGHD